MLWDMGGFSIHLIFGHGTIGCQFDRRTRPRLHFGVLILMVKIVCINGSSYLLG
jgi:hypothetical protein